MPTIIVSGTSTAPTISTSNAPTISSVLDRVARQCGVARPSSWVTASREDHVEIRDDFLMETIDDLLDRIDLPAPVAKQVEITGDDSENYDLPTDFRRVQRDQLAVYDTLLDRAVVPITNDGEWTYVKDIGTAGIIRYYRVKGIRGGNTIDFYDAPDSGTTITVSYISNIWKADSDGNEGDTFSAKDDVLLFPRRVVECGAIWRFRERRGLPYQDKYNEYEALVSRLSNDGRGRRLINFGEAPRDVRWQDLIPAYIPDS